MDERKTRPGGGMTCASFFAGIGGIDLALEQAGFETVYAADIDPYPVAIYNGNFARKAEVADIRETDAADIPEHTLLCGGFPCQAFSVAGYREGFSDRKGRGNLFFELARIAEARRPEALLFENVKNLKTHDHGRTYAAIRETLEGLGYTVFAEVLNACEYGNLPQNRERIYIAGFRDKEAAERFSWPEPVPLTKTPADIIGFGEDAGPKYYYGEACPFWEKLQEGVAETGEIYQWRRKYVRQNKKGLVPTLTANMGGGGHNVPLIRDAKGRIRKLTPRECLRVQGFPDGFAVPEGISDTRVYKAAGNSVAVPVVRAVAERIAQALRGGGSC